MKQWDSARQANHEDNGAKVESTEDIKKQLEDHKISTDLFGKGQARTLREFVQELQTGAARLMLDAEKCKTMVRVVDIVLLRITIGSGNSTKYLVRKETKDGEVEAP